ncbi:putative GMC oxidoreductase [Aspergillus clavatus NRRL 1]|uniref:glucose oxidase n=1 Tax=Aspergillus clavatus (strain ATCC 1007 / CBS 513.65 / DSM 816 / NCTC 3887 / NRRL 1 / QM 1276 / 107) TaxID=344612 RepID=A1C814_ASPCL|nr:GMC oxidoreductase, putative [Aspergillus clavatus NRRL 1]EAW14535.1 GMC oxidoreductase, putative [Aspergillus clavatus NRRL 1]
MGGEYALRGPVKAAWNALGVRYNHDLNSGNPLGLAEVVENRCDGRRQFSSSIYTLNVHKLTETLAKRVIIEKGDGRKVATAVELVRDDKKILTARREVILAAGAYRTPQLLMLSGIGPAEELQRHGIEVLLDMPDVGLNFHDHPSVTQWWKLRSPEKNLSVGSPAFGGPILSKGIPLDFIVVPLDGLRGALAKDETGPDPNKHPLISVQRAHVETAIFMWRATPRTPKSKPTVVTSRPQLSA